MTIVYICMTPKNVRCVIWMHLAMNVSLIQKDEVLKKLKSLKISSAAGPDNIHPRILKETQLEIAGPLKHIFQLSINEGTLPRDWKDGNITPIFKKGSRTNPANYSQAY